MSLQHPPSPHRATASLLLSLFTVLAPLHLAAASNSDWIDTNFDNVLLSVRQFLINHPAETILMRVKEEHSPESTTRSFAETFEWYRDQPDYAPIIWRGTTVPSLGQVRGKIVIIDDFSAGESYGIRWGELAIQDAYDFTDTDLQWELVRNHLLAAKTGDINTL
ncbi:hypothetical protein [Stigmatella aurantiaca]|uniref:1-phosphatidylinositol phosphodiesterase n=1 Tax=Stigmatella aurantiaca (strain DW4/3-1) TaxID=378806 RepID=Q098U8_STIAD|nr:hypothetical protein [Stigmatella aurantiaca]ADO75506.1 uncharacterized protein STAUR_7751 [Stigmatella aurantiaca DW4/3-1]EAU68256.1 1-phosphatidylinositol phosphodiesterase [Stigmatella aurantiaca DW4/3-1]